MARSGFKDFSPSEEGEGVYHGQQLVVVISKKIPSKGCGRIKYIQLVFAKYKQIDVYRLKYPKKY